MFFYRYDTPTVVRILFYFVLLSRLTRCKNGVGEQESAIVFSLSPFPRKRISHVIIIPTVSTLVIAHYHHHTCLFDATHDFRESLFIYLDRTDVSYVLAGAKKSKSTEHTDRAR